jgi:uncharacterized protein (TIGR00369 family)
MKDHLHRLEHMYLSAPVQNIYEGINILVNEGKAEVTLPVSPKFFHAGNALHGSVYFRLLDDACYFAVNSMVEDVFMLTSSFQIDLLRPVTKGTLISRGEVIRRGKTISFARGEIRDEKGKLVATGKGTFMRSNISLNQIKGYEEIQS